MRRASLPPLPPLVAQREGVFLPVEAIDWGLSYPRLRRLIRIGALHRVLGPVLSAEPLPLSPWAEAWAARLITEGVPSHGTAARLWGVADHVGVPTVTVDPRCRTRASGVVEHRHRLDADETQRLVRHGLALQVTAPARTVMDCAAELVLERAVAVGTAALQRRLVDLDALEQAARRRVARPGVVAMRHLLAELKTAPHSVGEWRFHRLLLLGGLTGWRANVGIRDGDELVAVADVLFDDIRLVVEFDGRRYHEDLDRRRYDRRRDRRLQLLGYTVVRFDWDDVVNRPQQVVAEVAQLVQQLLGRAVAG